MKKKELFLISGLIIFGFIFQYFDSGDISFIKGCNVNKHSIRDKSYPHEFTENFTFDLPVKGLEFDNRAGSVEISPAIDGKVKIESVKIVYHKNDSKVEKYKNMVKIEKSINGDKGIIKTGFEGEEFPYSRIRVHFKISVPPATILTVKNKFGAVNIKNISSDINVLNRFGKTRISNIKGKIGLDLKFSEAEVTGSSSIDCRISHSSLNLSDIRESNSIKIEGAHTKLTLSDINSDLIKIKNSHSRINLSDINAKEFLITSRHCKINADTLNSDSISIKNSHNSIRLKNLNGSTLNILLTHGDLHLSLSSMFKKIFVTNSYSDIKLAIPRGTNPSLSMNTKYGDIENRTDLEINSVKAKYLTTFSRSGVDSEVNINTSYGDITLSVNPN